MTKAIKVLLSICCAVVVVWFITSWAGIVVDNCEPNPRHSKYNAFVLMTQQKEKTKEPAEVEGLTETHSQTGQG